VLTIRQEQELLDNGMLLEHLSREGYGPELNRVERATAHNADRQFALSADREQVMEGWRHVLMLHRKAGVPRSLREAESDYLSDPTMENFSKLRAIVQQSEIAAT
jgi:DNA primase